MECFDKRNLKRENVNFVQKLTRWRVVRWPAIESCAALCCVSKLLRTTNEKHSWHRNGESEAQRLRIGSCNGLSTRSDYCVSLAKLFYYSNNAPPATSISIIQGASQCLNIQGVKIIHDGKVINPTQERILHFGLSRIQGNSEVPIPWLWPRQVGMCSMWGWAASRGFVWRNVERSQSAQNFAHTAPLRSRLKVKISKYFKHMYLEKTFIPPY